MPGISDAVAPGDIVVQWGKGNRPAHGLFLVEGALPIVHNAGGTGVVAHSAVEFQKYATLPVITDAEPGTRDYRVYRLRQYPALSRDAATIARSWASPFEGTKTVTTVKFSMMRLSEVKEMGAFVHSSAFRVLRAALRYRAGQSLSMNKGVTCSQFIIYCFQAAHILSLLAEGKLPISEKLGELLGMAPGERKKQGMKEKPYESAAVRDELVKLAALIRSSLPPLFAVDTKTANVQHFAEALERDAGVEILGKLALNATRTGFCAGMWGIGAPPAPPVAPAADEPPPPYPDEDDSPPPPPPDDL